LARVRGYRMGIEGLPVPPYFQNGEMSRSITLLQYLEIAMPLIRAAGLTVLPEQSSGLSRGRRHDFEVGHHIDGGGASVI
jgi:hypothetical protein